MLSISSLEAPGNTFSRMCFILKFFWQNHFFIFNKVVTIQAKYKLMLPNPIYFGIPRLIFFRSSHIEVLLSTDLPFQLVPLFMYKIARIQYKVSLVAQWLEHWFVAKWPRSFPGISCYVLFFEMGKPFGCFQPSIFVILHVYIMKIGKPSPKMYLCLG